MAMGSTVATAGGKRINKRESRFRMRYAGAPIATRVSFFLFPLIVVGDVAFSRVLFVPLPFSLCIKTTSYIFSFGMVFFYLVTTGWIFDISLCESSINRSNPPLCGTRSCCCLIIEVRQCLHREACCRTLVHETLKVFAHHRCVDQSCIGFECGRF